MWRIRNDFTCINFYVGLAESLPCVSAVNRFGHDAYGRYINPAVLSAYSSTLPNIEVMNWSFMPLPADCASCADLSGNLCQTLSLLQQRSAYAS